MTKIKIPKSEEEISTLFLDSYNGKNYEQIKDQLYQSLRPKSDEVLISIDDLDIEIIHYDILNTVVKKGNLNLFKELLNDKDFSNIIDGEFNNNFRYLCEAGHIDLLKYLLNFSKTNKNYKKKINLELINRGFVWACNGGSLEMIDFLLNSKDLPVNADIKTDAHKGIENACTMGHKEAVNYLLSSNNLKVHEDEAIAFKYCHECDLYEMINYLLFDYKITITPKIERYINKYEELKSLLEKIKTEERLNKELNIKQTNVPLQKNKI